MLKGDTGIMISYNWTMRISCHISNYFMMVEGDANRNHCPSSLGSAWYSQVDACWHNEQHLWDSVPQQILMAYPRCSILNGSFMGIWTSLAPKPRSGWNDSHRGSHSHGCCRFVAGETAAAGCCMLEIAGMMLDQHPSPCPCIVSRRPHRKAFAKKAKVPDSWRRWPWAIG